MGTSVHVQDAHQTVPVAQWIPGTLFSHLFWSIAPKKGAIFPWQTGHLRTVSDAAPNIE